MNLIEATETCESLCYLDQHSLAITQLESCSVACNRKKEENSGCLEEYFLLQVEGISKQPQATVVIRFLFFLSLFSAQLELALVLSIQDSSHTLAIILQAAGIKDRRGFYWFCFALLCIVTRSPCVTAASLDLAVWSK